MCKTSGEELVDCGTQRAVSQVSYKYTLTAADLHITTKLKTSSILVVEILLDYLIIIVSFAEKQGYN